MPKAPKKPGLRRSPACETDTHKNSAPVPRRQTDKDWFRAAGQHATVWLAAGLSRKGENGKKAEKCYLYFLPLFFICASLSGIQNLKIQHVVFKFIEGFPKRPVSVGGRPFQRIPPSHHGFHFPVEVPQRIHAVAF